MERFDITVVGGGITGSIAALSFARSGRKVAAVRGQAPVIDGRTTALMDQSIKLLKRLGLWEKLSPGAAPLSVMQIIDGTQRLLRAPTVQFRASELGLEAFGYNFPNRALLEVLEAALQEESNVTLIDGTVEKLEGTAEEPAVRLTDGRIIVSSFVVGADGRQSKIRACSDIDVKTWSYPQTAIVLNFKHSLPHHNMSTEFHTETGPFTQVPLPGRQSSLVWVVRPEEADELQALPLQELSLRIETRMQSMLGKVDVQQPPQAWSLSGMMARRFGKGRIALVGEAAHAFPPIGAQGLNLSLRDIMTLTEMLRSDTSAPIAADTGDRFDRSRRGDIMSRTASVDMLNRSLLSDMLPVQVLRAAGLHMLSAVPPLRNLIMREGIEPMNALRSFPSLFRRSG